PVDPSATQPLNDDERFIVGLVLSYYRRHPQRARSRLLELLGEALAPAAPPPGPADEETQLWRDARKGVAPLKRKR
ncbi:MAG TPA: hypothetical protein VFR86_27795, partial [Burkholderiaceae bacterium]|nr:hypothetical protein [Burkholderiaceae bacterium]